MSDLYSWSRERLRVRSCVFNMGPAGDRKSRDNAMVFHPGILPTWLFALDPQRKVAVLQRRSTFVCSSFYVALSTTGGMSGPEPSETNCPGHEAEPAYLVGLDATSFD